MQSVLLPARIILRNRGFVVVLVCNLLLGLAYSFVVPFMSMFGTIEAKMTPLRFSVFMVTTSLAAIVISTVLARWSDTHLSRRSMLILGSICGALGYVGYAFVRDAVWLTVIGSTVLALSSITFSQLFAHARELLVESKIPTQETPLYNNVFRLFFALAWTFGPAIASWIMLMYSYPGMFLGAAGLFILLLITVIGFIPESPPSETRRQAIRVSLRRTLVRRDLLAYFVGFVLINVCSTIGMMNLPLMVLNTLGGTPRDVGIVYSVGPVFEIPLMLYFGVLASKGDQTRVIRLGTLIAVVYYSLLLLVRAPWQVFPLQILSAAMVAVNSGVAITFFQNYVPDQPGTATNLFITAARIGSTTGYLLFGGLATALDHRTVFGICATLSAVTLLLFLHQQRQTRRDVLAAAAKFI
ncbi:MAG: sugar efflux transporter [Opitutus sp.]